MKIIKVGNGDSQYPGNFTKIERDIITQHLTGEVLNLFLETRKLGILE